MLATLFNVPYSSVLKVSLQKQKIKKQTPPIPSLPHRL